MSLTAIVDDFGGQRTAARAMEGGLKTRGQVRQTSADCWGARSRSFTEPTLGTVLHPA